MTNKPLIQVQNLHKNFSGQVLFKDITLNILPNQRFAICGPSGAGKSTLLRILAGLEEATSGQILKSEALRTQLVFQDLGLWPGYSILQQLYIAAKHSKIKNIEKKCNDLLKKLSLEDLALQKVETLSGGEAKRVALARALICEPNLLLLDEAFSSLDYENREKSYKLVSDLSKETGSALVLITHYEEDTRKLSLPVYDLVNQTLILR
jgi:ABC-type Fe3+/spermidine/putrescine transport system ATPase subunit